MFPQLIAGPIVRYADVAAQLRRAQAQPGRMPHTACAGSYWGCQRRSCLPIYLASLPRAFTRQTDLSVLYYWLGAAAFMLQIYL